MFLISPSYAKFKVSVGNYQHFSIEYVAVSAAFDNKKVICFQDMIHDRGGVRFLRKIRVLVNSFVSPHPGLGMSSPFTFVACSLLVVMVLCCTVIPVIVTSDKPHRQLLLLHKTVGQ